MVNDAELQFSNVIDTLVFRGAITPNMDAMEVLAELDDRYVVPVAEKNDAATSNMLVGEYLKARRYRKLAVPGVSPVCAVPAVLLRLCQDVPGLMKRLHPVTGKTPATR